VTYIIGTILLAGIDFAVEHHAGFWLGPVSYLFLTVGTFAGAKLILIPRWGSWASIGFRAPRPWEKQDRSVAVVGAIVTVLVGVIGLSAVHALEPKHGSSTGVVAGMMAVGALSALLAGLILMGLNRQSAWTKVLVMPPLAYSAFLIGAAIITALLQAISNFHVKGNAKQLLPPHQSHLTVGQFVALLVLAAVLAPVTEETLFRGVLYQALRRNLSARMGFVPAVALAALGSGTLFGLAHLLGGSGELNTLPILIYLGVVLAVGFQYTDTLAGSMLIHSSVNALAVIALFVH
ncbi:MAG TPA: CPBP family intramembrane glutamic endopeptidase, partial [Chloroflexota bacterium]|nr:CPBP family intramembrane glutamic endopeptidase [Chloroflexota bacterium]